MDNGSKFSGWDNNNHWLGWLFRAVDKTSSILSVRTYAIPMRRSRSIGDTCLFLEYFSSSDELLHFLGVYHEGDLRYIEDGQELVNELFNLLFLVVMRYFWIVSKVDLTTKKLDFIIFKRITFFSCATALWTWSRITEGWRMPTWLQLHTIHVRMKRSCLRCFMPASFLSVHSHQLVHMIYKYWWNLSTPFVTPPLLFLHFWLSM